MTRQELIDEINKVGSFLCVGLDPDLNRIPERFHQMDDPIYEFNKMIIDATKDHCVAYKPNIAFYECHGAKGWETLKKTLDYIPDNKFTIADAKRGDIGNTSTYYARTFFEEMNFDSVTVAPYMGEDSVKPFLEFEGKWVILLALTSNKGANDFQFFESADGQKLFEKVILKSQEWGTPENLMYVVGATRGEDIGDVRKLAPDHFFLVPGVGAQGGSLTDVANYAMTDDCGLLVNSSRGIIFSEDPSKAAQDLSGQMSEILTA